MLNARTLYFLIVALAFVAGGRVNGYYRDSLELNITRAAAKTGEHLRQELQAISSASARQLEGKLEEIAHAAPREIRTEVVKPVFTAVCVSPEFVRMYNETAESIERTLSGKRTDKMSGTVTPTGGHDR
ncbi:hypothetical protein QL112_006280 [Xenorhabdus griffiniae]|uniref:Uncharacterized protein n=2 Tax=Xenorhabdus griffiniae TaxID=351672 RepID=A0ABY9XNB0_9GAMM|nr:hypothetical protein [Xenorhabdus griffiniae]MBD1229324.1 hypothetical protein [Xenorhabdus griffiniae]MBE8588434.1 hypothetical protein [Xenorhabdus griffiniae]WMV74419.1 hypothetical protein QL128_06275 [Xenorhabdus griffiniae]WNH04098.1 hypothetical protein QL112_006280 [Xenorhabdus griffiniae]